MSATGHQLSGEIKTNQGSDQRREYLEDITARRVGINDDNPLGRSDEPMTRHDLEQAICDLQYLILNRFDPDKIEQYAERLHQLRCQLRALQQSETSALSKAAAAPLSHKASSNGI